SYDCGWSQSDLGVTSPSTVEDVLAMSTMIDESRPSYDLNSLCRWRDLPGKDDQLMKEALEAYGFAAGKGDLWRLPARFVGPYAAQDAVALLPLAASLRAEMVAQGLESSYRLE